MRDPILTKKESKYESKVTPAKAGVSETNVHPHGEAAKHSGEAKKELKKHLPKPDSDKLLRPASPSAPASGGMLESD
jgi:hypothetical protein